MIEGAADLSLNLETEMTRAHSMKLHFIVKLKFDAKLFTNTHSGIISNQLY